MFYPENPMESLVELHQKYGPIYVFQFPGHKEIMIASQELTHELCDQERFKKTVGGPLGEVRLVAGDGEFFSISSPSIADIAGLFTAHGHEPNWAIAHRILIPAFGPLSIRGTFDRMFEISTQLILKVS
jgi:cytochrome P450/NADPH-cytochrome P450 reductase